MLVILTPDGKDEKYWPFICLFVLEKVMQIDWNYKCLIKFEDYSWLLFCFQYNVI